MATTPDINIDTLRLNLASLPADAMMKALAALSAIGIDLSQNNCGLTNTRVVAFIVGTKAFKVSSHKEIFLKTSEIILKKFPEKEHFDF